MHEAYNKASDSGRYPANARQIMYAARPAIQERTGEMLSDVYFTQVLLPDFIREHPHLDYRSVDSYTMPTSSMRYFQRKITGSALTSAK